MFIKCDVTESGLTSIGWTGVMRDASTVRSFLGPEPLVASCWFLRTLSITSPRLREALKASYAFGSTASNLSEKAEVCKLNLFM